MLKETGGHKVLSEKACRLGALELKPDEPSTNPARTPGQLNEHFPVNQIVQSDFGCPSSGRSDLFSLQPSPETQAVLQPPPHPPE